MIGCTHKSRIISEVTGSLLRLAASNIKLPEPRAGYTHPRIRDNPKLYPFFNNCIGAVDGTHIPVKVPASQQAPYRNRKGILTMNVLVICDWDMKIRFLLTGWEGSAGDARIYLDAIHERNLRIPEPFYLLGDAGFGATYRILTPYRGVRYHLAEWERSSRQPETPSELFNLRHSQLRVTVERTIGRLKMMFAMFRKKPDYSLDSWDDAIVACAGVMNFVRDQNDESLTEWDLADSKLFELIERDSVPANRFYSREDAVAGQNARMNQMRDVIAQDMWDKVQQSRQH